MSEKGFFAGLASAFIFKNPLAFITGYGASDLFSSNKRNMEDSQTYSDRDPQTLVDQDKPIPIVYGKCKVGGNLVRVNAASEESCSVIVAYCEGPVYSATQRYVNDIAFGDLASVKSSETAVVFFYGTWTQDPNWPGWSRSSSFKGLCHDAITFKKDEQVSGRPNISLVISGRLCVSPDLNNGAAGIVESGTYQWTESGSGTNEFYCELDGGGDPGFDEPDGILIDGIPWAEKTVGELPSGYGSWDWGDNDTLGYSTIYVRLIDDADPDTKDDGFIQCTKFSRNPGTILYDYLITIEGYADTELDTTAFEALIVYCDVVPTGGTLPRYRFDFAIDSGMSHADVRKLICSSFHGTVFWSQGVLRPTWDKAQSSIHSFGMTTNILENSISWGQPKKYNLVRIKFRDLSDNALKRDFVEISDRVSVASGGEIAFEQECLFITDPEIARRRAQFIFDKIQYTNATGKLTGFPDSADVEIYNVVDVTHTSPGWSAKNFIVKNRSMDEYGRPTFDLEAYYAGIYSDGEVTEQVGYEDELPDAFAQLGVCTSLSATENTYENLDGSYDPSVTLSYTLPNDRIFWGWSEIHIKTGRDAAYRFYGKDMSEGTGFTIDGAKGNFKVGDTLSIKVISVSQDGIRSDSDTAPTTSVEINGVVTAPGAPTGLQLYGATASTSSVWKGNKFQIKWRRASETGGFGREAFGQELQNFMGSGVDAYWKYDEVELQTGGVSRGSWFTKETCFEYIFGDDQDAHLDNFVVAAEGSVTIRVRRWNNFNKVSDWTNLSITHESPTMTIPSTVFTGKDCEINWTPVTDPALKQYKIQAYSDSERNTLVRTEYVQNAHYNYTFEKNNTDNSGTPIRTVYFTVTVYNVFGQASSENCSGANATPSTPDAPSISAQFSALLISWTAVSDLDIIGYNVYVDDSSPASTLRGFTDGTTFLYVGDPSTLYYVKVAAVDKYGTGSLSSESNGTTTALALTSYDLDVPLTSGIDWSTDSKAVWTAGTLVYEGTVYSITGGNTTDAYIYWNKDSSPTTFLTSATRPTLGNDIYLMAYWNSTEDAIYPAKGYKILHAGLIQAASITADEIAASTITAAKMSVTELSAISANLGTITAGTVTGATIQTAASGQRIALSHADNTLRFDTATASDVIIIDDTINGSDPGIYIEDGMIYLYKSSGNASRIYTNNMIIAGSDIGACGRFSNAYTGNVQAYGLKGEYFVSSASVHGVERCGLIGDSQILNVGNNDDVIGLLGNASTTGTGSAWAGYFDDGNVYIKNDVISKQANDQFLVEDELPAKMSFIRNEDMNNLLDVAANRSTEELSEPAFTTHAKWTPGGVADDTGGNCAFVFAGGTLNGTLTQTAANRAETAENAKWYEFTYTVAVAVAPDGDFALTLDTISSASTTLPFTAGTHTVRFRTAAAASTADFVITATETTSTQGSFTIDDVSLMRCKEICVEAINTGTNSITLSWVPYIDELFSPTNGEEFACMNLENTSGAADPAKDGDYTEAFALESGVYATRVFTYTDSRGAEGNWSVGDRVVLYNPFRTGAFDASLWSSALIEAAGAGWRQSQVGCGGVFRKSDGTYVMLVNGWSAGMINTCGAFSSSDLETWSVLNSDAAIFSPSGNNDWYDHHVLFAGSVMKLWDEDRFIAYVAGYNDTDTKYRIGWVKFDEDFSAGSIEWSEDEIVDSSGSASGFYMPSVIRYGGKYRMIYEDRKTGNNMAVAWESREATSDKPEGPFTDTGAALTGLSSNEGTWRSGWTGDHHLFIWKGRLYCFVGGTSIYLASGTRGHRCTGLMYWDEKLSTPAWHEDPRSPIIIPPFHGDDIWSGDYAWCDGHTGGHTNLIMNQETGYLYVFFSTTAGTNQYKVSGVKLNIQNLLA